MKYAYSLYRGPLDGGELLSNTLLKNKGANIVISIFVENVGEDGLTINTLTGERAFYALTNPLVMELTYLKSEHETGTKDTKTTSYERD